MRAIIDRVSDAGHGGRGLRSVEILLCSSSRAGGWFGGVEESVDLAGEVALEEAADLSGGEPFGGASLNVGAGVRVVGHAGDRRGVQDLVRLAVPAATCRAADDDPAATVGPVVVSRWRQAPPVRVFALMVNPRPTRSGRAWCATFTATNDRTATAWFCRRIRMVLTVSSGH